ncbi:MAG TPA: hypothetical protein VJ600_11255 [Holophagaceae bacterium]|nr:hypothetical protein [Holophagaceae bacterium]
MTRRRLLALLGAGCLALAGGVWVLRARPFARAPRRVKVEAMPGWAGFNDRQREGLLMIASDALELGGGTLLNRLPDGAPRPAGTGLLRLEARREGDVLRLRGEWTSPKGVDQTFEWADPDPRQNLQRMASDLGFASPDLASLLPSEGQDLVPAAEALATVISGSDAEVATLEPQVASLAAREPSSSLAALIQAQGLYRSLLVSAPADFDSQIAARRGFLRSLSLLPGYPRACTYYARFLTDIGDQREALELAFEGVRIHPASPDLLGALAYAARTTGLLEGARRALDRQRRLQGSDEPMRNLTENTWLYLGEWKRFGELLGQGSEELRDPLTDFYRGYLKLLQGRGPEAMPFFRRAENGGGTSSQFEALAGVYLLALEGRDGEARARLRDLESLRTQVRVPDGEYTFKLAEAHAYLGEIPEALDGAVRAASQGFGCTSWYEGSPLLKPIRGLPRWQALIQHLRERQLLMESRFPASRFGP